MSLSHINSSGEAHMVDVSEKQVSLRSATAACEVVMKKETLEAVQLGNTPKGDVVSTARLAGVIAAKQTAQLIPLCHPLPLKAIDVDITADPQLPGYRITATVKTKGETGVEMEALTAVTIAALTLYDMTKGIEKTMTITNVRLLQKTGGKSGDFVRVE